MSAYASLCQVLSAVYPDGEARAIARWVMEDTFRFTHTDLLLGKDNDLSAEDLTKLENITHRLLQREPVQYVLGQTVFCGHRFRVRPGVLIPRPETEDLVHAVVDAFPQRNEGFVPSVLDVGTGSGCIALSLALAGFRATAWDISEQALSVAKENAREQQVEVLFQRKDILHLGEETDAWDCIVSNPPYIRFSEKREMEDNVVDYEPHLALFVSDEDPLVFYRAIAEFAFAHLHPGGCLCFEMNRYLYQETMDLVREIGFQNINLQYDRYGHPRILICRLSQ